MNIDKTIKVGTTKIYKSVATVYCHIKFDGKKLSITGVEGPKSDGNCLGSCGQISQPKFESYALGWNKALADKFWNVWHRWHLNNMRAGTPAQEDHLRQFTYDATVKPYKSYYDWACDRLSDRGILNHNGYKYGSAWLFEEVPTEVLEFLNSLPESDTKPAWI